MTRSSEDAVPQKSAPSPNKRASSKSVADKGSPGRPDAASTAATATSNAATSTTATSTTESGSAAQRDRRRRILDATLALASKGGYDAVQMRTVAEKADVAGSQEIKEQLDRARTDREAARRVELSLPDTGVCGGAGLFDGEEGGGGGCCAPAPAGPQSISLAGLGLPDDRRAAGVPLQRRGDGGHQLRLPLGDAGVRKCQAIEHRVAALQVGAELLVGRNYALALLCITPLALMMGQIVHEVPVGPLLVDRAVETLIGCGVALVVLLVVRDPAH